jgi:hypothetical protein
LYCNESIEELTFRDDKFTKEHILPTSIIGSINQNFLILKNVCSRCNNQAGVLIDAPLSKSWFMHHEIARYYNDYTEINKRSIVPLRFMGTHKTLNYEGKIADMFLGPTGDTIYHFHLPYPKLNSYPAIIGIPPQFKSKKFNIDFGFVFIFVASDNPIWFPTIFHSVIKQFKRSILYLGNGEPPKIKNFRTIPDSLIQLHSQLLEIKTFEVKFQFTPFSENRFLAKAALGIGDLYLGKDFRNSVTAQKLRNFMWAKSEKEQKNIELKGTHFFDPTKLHQKEEYLSWEGGHLISLNKIGKGVALSINLFNSISATIFIEGQYVDFSKIKDGICIAISPATNSIIGPIKISEFIAHKYKLGFVQKELANCELRMRNIKDSKPVKEINKNSFF